MKRRLGLSAVVLATATACALAFGAARGSASLRLLSCGGTYTQPFASWGDGSSYALAPGGSFEGWTGWNLSGGAQIVNGNEPFPDAAGGSHSLLLPPGSSATSPAVCLGTLDPKARFFGFSSDGSPVHVQVFARTLLGLIALGSSADAGVGTSWGPSGQIGLLLDNVSALLELNLARLGTTEVYFRLTPAGSATDQVDDFYVDPMLQG